MPVELFDKDNHVCVAFRDLVFGEAIQANQFLIFDSDHAALIDPGGDLTYSSLFMEISAYMNVKDLDYVLASHQDPDIVASLNKCLVGTNCKVVVPALWERFVPHFTRPGKLDGRVIPIPDKGMNLRLGGIELKAVPAHFRTRKAISSFTIRAAAFCSPATSVPISARRRRWTSRPSVWTTCCLIWKGSTSAT